MMKAAASAASELACDDSSTPDPPVVPSRRGRGGRQPAPIGTPGHNWSQGASKGEYSGYGDAPALPSFGGEQAHEAADWGAHSASMDAQWHSRSLLLSTSGMQHQQTLLQRHHMANYRNDYGYSEWPGCYPEPLNFDAGGEDYAGSQYWSAPAQGLVETPTVSASAAAPAPFLMTMPTQSVSPQSASSHLGPECVWIPVELEEDDTDASEPRIVRDTYCGASEPKRRLPKGVPVKKAVPPWGPS